MKKDILYINSVDDIRIIDMLRVQGKHDYSKDYLTFEALEDGAFAYTICYGTDPEMADIPLSLQASAKLQYSFNGKDWFDWVRQNLTSESINVLANQKLYIRGYTKPIEDAYGTVNFSSTCRFNVCGLLSSLLYGYDYANNEFIWTKQSMEDTHFFGLFESCDKLISAENLILPQELVRECYVAMFSGCTSLTVAPELPATILADGCYCRMFSGCTSLATAPELPATTLAIYCYSEMFSDCTLLTAAPTLPAITLVQYCYNHMFYSCSKLNYIKAMFTTTQLEDSEVEGEYIYTGQWLENVASTGTFVKNSAAIWNVTGISGIPTGWTVETANS